MTALTGLVTLAGLAAGCATKSVPPPRQSQQPVPPAIQQEFDTRAPQIAEAWEASGNAQTWQHGFIPLAGLTLDPEGDGTDATKVAISNGWYRLNALLLDPAPPGTITFPDGSTMTVPLETAEDAFQQIARTPPAGCSSGVTTTPRGSREPCKVLTVTGMVLAADNLPTSRGEAVVPVWRFTVAGLDSPVERVAVDPSAITEPPAAKGATPLRDILDPYSVVSAHGTTLTLQFMGGDSATHTVPLMYEDADTVVLGVWYTENGSDLVGVTRQLTVSLRAPIGTRVVLGVDGGNPVPPVAVG